MGKLFSALCGIIVVDQQQLFTVFVVVPVKVQPVHEKHLYAPASRFWNVDKKAFVRLADHISFCQGQSCAYWQ
jgi:hypothetical protein